MKILVDADACPVVIKEMLFRATKRTQTHLCLVANHLLKTPPSKYIQMICVKKGFDVADDEIVKLAKAGDLVITSDIPLANDVIQKGALALSPRGELFSVENIKAKLNMRDFMDTMRSSGIQTAGLLALTQRDKQNFANQLDKWLAKKYRN